MEILVIINLRTMAELTQHLAFELKIRRYKMNWQLFSSKYSATYYKKITLHLEKRIADPQF